jgi:flagellar assembly protein FliH
MISSSNIIKRHSVHLDSSNAVTIKVLSQSEMPEREIAEEDGVSAEEKAITSAVMIIKQAERDASVILTQARVKSQAEHDAFMQTAREQAEDARRNAYEMGYQEGLDTAVAVGEDIKAQAAQVLEEAQNVRKNLEDTLEPDMVELVMAIIDKLILDTTIAHPEVIINLIRQGLESTMVSGDVKIFVSSADFALVSGKKEEIASFADTPISVEVFKDLSLNPLDCIISTPMGDIDVSLAQQYGTLKANVKQILARGEAS